MWNLRWAECFLSCYLRVHIIFICRTNNSAWPSIPLRAIILSMLLINLLCLKQCLQASYYPQYRIAARAVCVGICMFLLLLVFVSVWYHSVLVFVLLSHCFPIYLFLRLAESFCLVVSISVSQCLYLFLWLSLSVTVCLLLIISVWICF